MSGVHKPVICCTYACAGVYVHPSLVSIRSSRQIVSRRRNATMRTGDGRAGHRPDGSVAREFAKGANDGLSPG